MPSLTFHAAFFSLFKAFEIHIVDDSLSPSNPLFTSGLCPPPASYLPFYPSSTLCIDSLCSLSVYEGRKQWDECSGHGRGHFHCILLAQNPPTPTQVCRALPPVVPPLPPDYVRVIRGLDMLYQD